MTDAETIAAEIRRVNPYFPVSEGSAQYVVDPDELPEDYEAIVAHRVAIALEERKRIAEENGERSRIDRVGVLLAAIETGTNAEALAALREAVPILIRREVRRGLRSG